jgi:hypothetical protein
MLASTIPTQLADQVHPELARAPRADADEALSRARAPLADAPVVPRGIEAGPTAEFGAPSAEMVA